MAIVKSVGPDIGPITRISTEPEVEISHSIADIFGAAFRTENTVGSLIAHAARGGLRKDYDVNPDFDAYEKIQGTKYEQYADRYIWADNDEEFDTISRRIDLELQDKQILDESGVLGFVAQLSAGGLDPINLLPVGGAVVRIGKTGGSLLRGFTSAGRAGLMGSTAAEVALQATQETRTIEESAISIGSATLLSGALGTGMALLRRNKETKASGRLHDEVKADPTAQSRDPSKTVELADEFNPPSMDELGRAVDEDMTIPADGQADPWEPAQSAQAAEDITRRVSEEEVAETLEPDDGLVNRPTDSSAGAKSVKDTSLDDEGLSSALGLEKVLGFQDPLLRTLNSPSIAARRITQKLAEVPLQLAKNLKGVPTVVGGAVETRVKMWHAPLAESLVDLDDLYIQYRKGRARRVGDVALQGIQDLRGVPEGILSKKQFHEAAGYAARRGDNHEIPEVAKAAKSLREKVFEPLKQKAIELGALPEDVDVTTADSYLSRLYDFEKIAAQRPEFKRVIRTWLIDEQVKKADLQERVKSVLLQRADVEAGLKKGTDPEAEARLIELQDELEKLVSLWEGKSSKAAKSALKRRNEKLAKRAKEGKTSRLKEADKAVLDAAKIIEKANTSLEKQELDDLASQIIDRILGTPGGRLPYDVQVPAEPASKFAKDDFGNVAGTLKQRSFNIPDELIEPWLQSDIEVVAKSYVRSMAPDVELIRAFGDVELESVEKEILDDFNRLIDDAPDQNGRDKLEKQRKAAIRDVRAMRDRIRGVYAMPSDPNSPFVRTSRVVRNLNYLRLLGGMTLSAIPDIARTTMVHGFGRTLNDGIIPMIRNFKAYRAASAEIKLAGTALDWVLDSRAMAIADIMDDYGRNSAVERAVERAVKGLSDNFGMVSLMAPWNAAMKQFSGVVTTSRLLDASIASKTGKVSDKELVNLAASGISEDLAVRIAKQFEEFGESVDGAKLANTADWTDREAAEALRAAIVRDVDRIIVTPGQDKPLWMSTETGKLIGQFRSFSFASTQRVLLSGLQQRDAAAFSGALMMVGLGMVAYALKQHYADRPLSDNPATWIAEGVDRSGLTGWFMDINNIVEKVSRGTVGVSALTGGPTISRYQSRNIIGSLAGPSVGLLSDFAQVTGSAVSGDMRTSDTRALRRLLPYQNLFYMRGSIDAVERGVNDFFGVEGQSK